MKLIIELVDLQKEMPKRQLDEDGDAVYQSCGKLSEYAKKFQNAFKLFDSAKFKFTPDDKTELERGNTYWFFDSPPPANVTVENFKAILDSCTTSDDMKNYLLFLMLQTRQNLLRESPKVYTAMMGGMPGLDSMVADNLHQHRFKKMPNGDLLLEYFNYISINKVKFKSIIDSARNFVVGEISATIRVKTNRVIVWDQYRITFDLSKIREYNGNDENKEFFDDNEVTMDVVEQIKGYLQQLKEILRKGVGKGSVKQVNDESFQVLVPNYIRGRSVIDLKVQQIFNFAKEHSLNFNDDRVVDNSKSKLHSF